MHIAMHRTNAHIRAHTPHTHTLVSACMHQLRTLLCCALRCSLTHGASTKTVWPQAAVQAGTAAWLRPTAVLLFLLPACRSGSPYGAHSKQPRGSYGGRLRAFVSSSSSATHPPEAWAWVRRTRGGEEGKGAKLRQGVPKFAWLVR